MKLYPTPVHVALRVSQALRDEAARRGELLPTWVEDAIDAGVACAVAECDAVQAVRFLEAVE